MNLGQNKLFEITPEFLSKIKKLIIAGDVHGDFESFKSIRDSFNPDQDCVIFLGDYADRGPKGVEVIEGVNELRERYPQNVVSLKGNHEDYTEDGRPTFVPCTLIGEADEKRGSWANYFSGELKPFIKKLHLAAIIPGKVLFVHGGVSTKIGSLEDLRYPSKHVEVDVLWSDPFEGRGEYPNERGAGVMFGKDVSKQVCQRMGVSRIVRSHEPRKAMRGSHVEHDERVVTINSTKVYGGIPFVLNLPTENLSGAFKDLEKYTLYIG